MHIITKRRLREALEVHPDAWSSLQLWIQLASTQRWRNLADVRANWPTADLVGKLTVFNISGNKYRLITYIDYPKGKIFIRWFLTHAEYDKEQWKRDPWA